MFNQGKIEIALELLVLKSAGYAISRFCVVRSRLWVISLWQKFR